MSCNTDDITITIHMEERWCWSLREKNGALIVNGTASSYCMASAMAFDMFERHTMASEDL